MGAAAVTSSRRAWATALVPFAILAAVPAVILAAYAGMTAAARAIAPPPALPDQPAANGFSTPGAKVGEHRLVCLTGFEARRKAVVTSVELAGAANLVLDAVWAGSYEETRGGCPYGLAAGQFASFYPGARLHPLSDAVIDPDDHGKFAERWFLLAEVHITAERGHTDGYRIHWRSHTRSGTSLFGLDTTFTTDPPQPLSPARP